MPYLRNKRTGETVFVPDQTGAPQAVPVGPQNPTYPLEAPKMGADIANTQAGTARTQVQTRGDVLSNVQAQKDIRNNPIGDKDQALINQMRLAQGDLPGVLRDITAAQAAVDRFRPSPSRGADYSWGVPDDNDNPIYSAAKNAYAWFRGMPDQSKKDYQTLLGLQNQSVLNAQVAQKGPQTESDAIRMKLTGVSPNKDVGPNAQLLAEQQYDTMMKLQRPSFYEYWANRLGSTHALNSQGKSADQVWQEQYQRGYERMRNGPGYRRAAGRGIIGSAARNAPRKPASNVIDFNDWKD